MSIENAASAERATQKHGRVRIRTLLTFALCVFPTLTAPAAYAQNAKTVMDKMIALYKGAKSYSGVKVVRQMVDREGKKSTVTNSTQIKYAAPNKFAVTATVSATGAIAAQVGNGSSINVSDGTTMWLYASRQKKYIKQPLPPAAKVVSLAQIAQIPDVPTASAKMLPPESVQGRPAFVVSLQLPGGQRPGQPAPVSIVARIYIDKQNFHLLRISASTPGGPTDVTYGSQSFNVAIPASAFHFTPPAGSTEFKPPMGAPGAPGVPGKH